MIVKKKPIPLYCRVSYYMMQYTNHHENTHYKTHFYEFKNLNHLIVVTTFTIP